MESAGLTQDGLRPGGRDRQEVVRAAVCQRVPEVIHRARLLRIFHLHNACVAPCGRKSSSHGASALMASRVDVDLDTMLCVTGSEHRDRCAREYDGERRQARMLRQRLVWRLRCATSVQTSRSDTAVCRFGDQLTM